MSDLLTMLRPHLDNPDEADLATAVDRLQEAGATLTDLLLLYRGAPPEFLGSWQEDEALRKLVAKWCQATEFGQLIDPSWWQLYRISIGLKSGETMARWAAVLACSAVLARSAWQAERDDDWRPAPSARRQQKRTVLSLFPEVVIEARFRMSLENDERYRKSGLLARALAAHGIDTSRTPHGCKQHGDGTVSWFQRLAAPNWIPPEPARASDFDSIMGELLYQRLIESYGVPNVSATSDSNCASTLAANTPPLPPGE